MSDLPIARIMLPLMAPVEARVESADGVSYLDLTIDWATWGGLQDAVTDAFARLGADAPS